MTEAFGGFVPFTSGAQNKIAAVPQDVTPGSMKDRNQAKRSKILRYPEDVGSADQGHYIIFDIMKQDPKKLKAARAKAAVTDKSARPPAPGTGVDIGDVNLSATTAKAGKVSGPNSIAVANEGTTQLSTSIALYMPPSIQVQYGAKYADQEIGRVTETGVSAIRAFMAGGNLVESALDAGAAIGKGLLSGGLSTVLAKGPAGTKAIAEIEMGAIIAPRMELMFEGISRRDFSFNFQFVPKSDTESATVFEIVKMFKYHMASDYGNPGSKKIAGGSYLGGADGVRNMTIPDFFDITYMFQQGPNPYLNKIKRCVLQTVDVTYGDDRFKAYPDGAPQTTKLNLNFKELEIITKSYIDQGF